MKIQSRLARNTLSKALLPILFAPLAVLAFNPVGREIALEYVFKLN